MSTVSAEVDDFVRKYRNLDYVIDERALKVWYDDHTESKILGKTVNLTDNLANSISVYEMSKDGTETNKMTAAQNCLAWVNRAFACGVVKEGQGLATKLRQCEERNAQLQKDLEKLSADYLRLKGLQEQFSKFRLPHTEEDGDNDPPS